MGEYSADGGPTEMDVFDAWNLGLFSHAGKSRPELEMSYLGRLLSRGRDLADGQEFLVKIVARCPGAAGRSGPVVSADWGVRGREQSGAAQACSSAEWSRPPVLGATWIDAEEVPGQASWTARIRTSGVRSTMASPSVAEAWQALRSGFQFHYNSPELDTSVTEIRRRRVGSCEGLSTILQHMLTERDVTARLRQGYLWGGLGARRHVWVEVAEGGEWKPLDPSLALLAAGGHLDAGLADYSFGSLTGLVVPVPAGERAAAGHLCADGETAIEVDLSRLRPSRS
jgi:hypothetical protein